MNPKPFDLWLMQEMLLNPRRRIRHVQYSPQRVNPPHSASPEVRAQRARQKAAQRRKKAKRKESRRAR